MVDVNVNVPAVIVAAIAAFAIGAVWYSPLLFAKAWMAANGYTPEKMEAMKERRGPAVAMTVSAVCQFVTAFILSVLIGFTGMAGWAQGLGLGVLVWLGFAAATGLLGNMFSDKPLSAYLIDTGYHLVYLAIMGAILGGWR